MISHYEMCMDRARVLNYRQLMVRRMQVEAVRDYIRWGLLAVALGVGFGIGLMMLLPKI